MNIREIIDIEIEPQEIADRHYQIRLQSLEQDKKSLMEYQPVSEQWKQEKLARIDSRMQNHIKNGPRRRGYVSLFNQNPFLIFHLRGR